ncbi:MAG: hypothetical protein JW936_00175 [Sedimentisphaerales bacterium]|nr:hypothetical protein [Sedimentisphaerales bacterium]
MLAYVFDAQLKSDLNEAGRNYWDVYLEELCRFLGVGGWAIGPEAIADIADMGVRVLIVGRETGNLLDGDARDGVRRWVKDGGIVIGFGVTGLDDVFGISRGSVLEQKNDDYTISAHFDLRLHELTHEIHPMMFQDQRLLILSDVERIETFAGVELAGLYDTNGNELGCPAMTWHEFGKGWAGYFAFDVAKTMWLLHQGKPIPAEVQQTPRYPRAYDLCVLGNNSRKIPYADELAFLVQNMIAQSGLPLVHQIPPKDGKVADALFYWGGDEYTGPTELSLKASDWMKEKQLPYHINLQAENHPMTAQEYQHILDNGHEISEYYHMLEEDGGAAYEGLYVRQSREFYERFGVWPITTVNCVLRWNGWADSARWMAKAGSKADNSFSGHPITLDHPLANSPFFGFGAGTAFPFNFYDDAAYGNEKIDMIEQPIVCYEIGHRGSLLDKATAASEDVHLPVEMAIKYHMTMNMFYHPVYIARYPLCRAAIEEILATIDRHDAKVVQMGNDALHHWWTARAQIKIADVSVEADCLKFACDCNYEDGTVIKMLAKRPIDSVYCDGRQLVDYEVREEFAGSWVFIVVPNGSHTVEIRYE